MKPFLFVALIALLSAFAGASTANAKYGLEPGGYAQPNGYHDDGRTWRTHDSNDRYGRPAYVGDEFGASRPLYRGELVGHTADGSLATCGVERACTIITTRRPEPGTAMPWRGYDGGRSWDW
jgi:hypothetical protein